jgi:hypothetical protein
MENTVDAHIRHYSPIDHDPLHTRPDSLMRIYKNLRQVSHNYSQDMARLVISYWLPELGVKLEVMLLKAISFHASFLAPPY